MSIHRRRIFGYEGKGRVVLAKGEAYKCQFAALQLNDGSIRLSCEFSLKEHPPHYNLKQGVRLEGVTGEGKELIATHLLQTDLSLTSSGSRSEVKVEYRVNNLTVKYSEAKAKFFRFGVANLEFVGDTPLATGFRSHLSLPIEIDHYGQAIEVVIDPSDDYSKEIKEVKKLRSTGVTAWISGQLIDSFRIRKAYEILDNLCEVLSVGRGTRIQFVVVERLDHAKRLVRRDHVARITKPFSPLAPIDPSSAEETRAFLQQAYSGYLSRKSIFEKGLVDSLLDAKSESDFVELRAAKLAVTLESLKSQYLSTSKVPDQFSILDVGNFNAIKNDVKKAIKKILIDHCVSSIKRKEVYAKLEELNRKSFKFLLRDLFNEIGFNCSQRELDLFISSRNKLVHEGDFYVKTATPEERNKCRPLRTVLREFYFMINFLDRIFLQLLGYNGPYINWRFITANRNSQLSRNHKDEMS